MSIIEHEQERAPPRRLLERLCDAIEHRRATLAFLMPGHAGPQLRAPQQLIHGSRVAPRPRNGPQDRDPRTQGLGRRVGRPLADVDLAAELDGSTLELRRGAGLTDAGGSVQEHDLTPTRSGGLQYGEQAPELFLAIQEGGVAR